MPESVYKVIELVGTSTESWEKAAKAAVDRAAQTLRDLRVAEVVEEYDDGYYATFKELEMKARDMLVEGKRHLYEAEMKEDRRTHGDPHHTAVPASPADQP